MIKSCRSEYPPSLHESGDIYHRREISAPAAEKAVSYYRQAVNVKHANALAPGFDLQQKQKRRACVFTA